MPADSLDDFEAGEFEFGGTVRPVFRGGDGPAVIVIHEVPGITPAVADFARRVVDRGYRAVLPSLFGTPGREPSAPYLASSLARACVAREFTVMALNRTSPVIGWLLALSRAEHAAAGGPGVGVVGMCFTGGFALGMAVDPVVQAPVLSQPSLPFAVGARRREATGVSDADLSTVRERVESGGACLLGLRFTADRLVPAERFATLARELGDGFIAVEIDSGPGNPNGIPARAHSVLTEDLVDEPGHPTREALERVLEFLDQRLGPRGS